MSTKPAGGYQTAMARPMGYRKDLFVFELRRWAGPRPNQATGQFHAFVFEKGVVTRLVGCAGLSGAVCLFPTEREIHVALATRIMRFEKQGDTWVRVQDLPQKIGVTEFRVFPTQGAVCWSTTVCWKWDGADWVPYPFPVTRFGTPFAFSDIQEYQGRLYAVGYAGIILVLEETGWREASSPTAQAIQVAAVGDNSLLIAARTTSEAIPGGIWGYDHDQWSQLAAHASPTSFMSMCVFRDKIYASIDGMGVFVVQQGVLIPYSIPEQKIQGLTVSASADALFIATAEKILFSDDGIQFESFSKSEALPFLPC